MIALGSDVGVAVSKMRRLYFDRHEEVAWTLKQDNPLNLIETGLPQISPKDCQESYPGLNPPLCNPGLRLLAAIRDTQSR
jgi:hypothetical protein